LVIKQWVNNRENTANNYFLEKSSGNVHINYEAYKNKNLLVYKNLQGGKNTAN